MAGEEVPVSLLAGRRGRQGSLSAGGSTAGAALNGTS